MWGYNKKVMNFFFKKETCKSTKWHALKSLNFTASPVPFSFFFPLEGFEFGEKKMKEKVVTVLLSADSNWHERCL